MGISTTLSFYVLAGDPNPGPPVCVESAFRDGYLHREEGHRGPTPNTDWFFHVIVTCLESKHGIWTQKLFSHH